MRMAGIVNGTSWQDRDEWRGRARPLMARLANGGLEAWRRKVLADHGRRPRAPSGRQAASLFRLQAGAPFHDCPLRRALRERSSSHRRETRSGTAFLRPARSITSLQCDIVSGGGGGPGGDGSSYYVETLIAHHNLMMSKSGRGVEMETDHAPALPHGL